MSLIIRNLLTSRWRFAGIFAWLTVLGCLGSPSEPLAQIRGEGRKALFVGNSYLYTMDVPGIVLALADSAGGDRIAVAMITGPNMALVDHWKEGWVQTQIATGGWEWLILQQGPSSTPVNRDSLRLMTALYAERGAKVGATTALFSAWPAASRLQDFAAAIESYQLAATDVGGLYLPVAPAWLRAWELDANLQLYADDLHPSAEGAYLSALVVYACLLRKTPVGLPRQVSTIQRVVGVTAATAQVLQTAADDVARVSCGLP